MGRVTLVKPNGGGEIEVDESSVPYLVGMGYSERTAEERAQTTFERSVDEEYNDLGSTVLSGVEGFVRGVSGGLVDALPEFQDEASRFREQENPWVEGTGEVAGYVVPAILTGGASVGAKAGATVATKVAAKETTKRSVAAAAGGQLLANTPAGLIARGGEKAAEALAKRGVGRTGQLAAQGVAEGLGQATTSLVASALAGDEVTPEAVFQEIGYGAMFGLGGGVAGRGLEKASESITKFVAKRDEALKQADDLAAKAQVDAARNPLYDSPEAYQYNKRIKGVVQEEVARLDKELLLAKHEYGNAARLRAQAAKGQHDVDVDMVRAHGEGGMLYDDILAKDLQNTGDIRRGGRDTLVDESPRHTLPVSDSQIIDGANVGPYRTQAVRESQIGTHADTDPTNSLFDEIEKGLEKASDRLTNLQLARDMLAKAPDLSLESLAKLDEDGIAYLAHDFFSKLDRFDSASAKRINDEMAGAFGKAAPKLRDWEALDILGLHKVSEKSIEKIAAAHDIGKNAAALWATLKAMDAKVAQKAAKKAAKTAVGEAAERDKTGLVKGAVRRMAARAAGVVAGGSAIGGPLGYLLGWAMADVAVAGKSSGLSKTVSNTKRRALLATAKGLKSLSGPGRPAAVVAMSTEDKLKTPMSPMDDVSWAKQQNDLVNHRIEAAIFAASSGGRERLADILTPLRAKSPEMAAALEQDALRRAQYLAKHAPKKPGWAAMVPDFPFPQDQVDRFATVHRAISQPLSVLEDFGRGTLDPEAAAAFRETSPGLFKIVSQFVLEHFDPVKADYKERFNVSLLLGVPMAPELTMTATLQQNFTKPNPPAAPAAVGDPNVDKHMTAATRTSER